MALPIFLLFLLAVADVARAFVVYIEINNVAREGAHYGSLSLSKALDSNGIRQAALRELGPSSSLFGVTPSVTSSCIGQLRTNPLQTAPCPASGLSDANYFYTVSVQVQGVYTPLIRWPLLPSQYSISRTVQMRVLDIPDPTQQQVQP